MTTSYPIHQVEVLSDYKKSFVPKRFAPCGTTGAMVLMEQTKRAADGPSLFCLRCVSSVLASEAEHAQAVAAAKSEGWVPPPSRTAPMTPGDLPEATRHQLAGLVRMERLAAEGLTSSTWYTSAKAEADTKFSDGEARGYVSICGHTVGRHTNSDTGKAAARCPCRECACKQYVQQKPAATDKPKRAKKAAAAA